MAEPQARRAKAGRPADTDSAETRRRIVRCAQEHFAENGFDATTNRQIADAAGISTAALYHYFPSKGDIYVAVCERIGEIISSSFTRAAGQGTDLLGRVKMLVDDTYQLGVKQTSALVFITGMSNDMKSHPEMRLGSRRMQNKFKSHIVSIIKSADDTTGILEGTTREAFADFLGSVLAGFARMSARGDHQRHAEAGRTLIHLLSARAPK